MGNIWDCELSRSCAFSSSSSCICLLSSSFSVLEAASDSACCLLIDLVKKDRDEKESVPEVEGAVLLISIVVPKETKLLSS